MNMPATHSGRTILSFSPDPLTCNKHLKTLLSFGSQHADSSLAATLRPKAASCIDLNEPLPSGEYEKYNGQKLAQRIADIRVKLAQAHSMPSVSTGVSGYQNGTIRLPSGVLIDRWIPKVFEKQGMHVMPQQSAAVPLQQAQQQMNAFMAPN